MLRVKPVIFVLAICMCYCLVDVNHSYIDIYYHHRYKKCFYNSYAKIILIKHKQILHRKVEPLHIDCQGKNKVFCLKKSQKPSRMDNHKLRVSLIHVTSHSVKTHGFFVKFCCSWPCAADSGF